MTAAELIAALVANIGVTYPSRLAERSNRPGAVTVVVQPSGGTYMSAGCDPAPVEVEAEVEILAAGSDAQSVKDLLTHIDPVASLVRGAGFHPTGWRSGSTDGNVPSITITATANGEG